MTKHYIDSKELQEWWTGWLITGCPYAWDQMCSMIFKICEGVARHFHPPTPDEHQEHAHDAFIMTIDKIKSGKLKFDPGRAPVFNLLTTTIFRHLYSKMNKETRRKKHHLKYIHKHITEQHPDLIKTLEQQQLVLTDP